MCVHIHVQVLVAFPSVVHFHDGLKTNPFMLAER